MTQLKDFLTKSSDMKENWKSVTIFVIVVALTSVLVTSKLRNGLEKLDNWLDNKVEKIQNDKITNDSLIIESIVNDSI